MKSYKDFIAETDSRMYGDDAVVAGMKKKKKCPKGKRCPDSKKESVELDEKDDGEPCWEGYEMVGMKDGPDGRPVPNCVPVKESTTISMKERMNQVNHFGV